VLAPNEASRLPTSAAGKDEQIARLTHERDEALDQQAATTDVLELISSSPENLQAIFAAILENAVRICDASFGDIGQLEDGIIRLLAIHKATPAPFIEERKRTQRVPPAPNSPSARILATKVPLHIHDLKCDGAYHQRSAPMTVAAVELGGLRTFLGVPLLRENEVVGIMFLGRQFVRPFTDRQIELVKNFAAQAVIAIENARLLNELRQRTTDLTEALGQQTATSDVLQVISSSTDDLEPVFGTMLEKAVRYCDANFGTLFLCEKDQPSLVAAHNMPTAFSEAHRSRPGIVPGGPVETAMRTRRTVHMPDLAAMQSYLERHPRAVDAVELGGVRTTVAVPMLKDDEPIGVIVIHRPEVRPFTDKQIALVTNFAAQAVIAIENARLLNELRQSLEQQTATSEGLQVISSSPGDLRPVFATMLEKAVRICDAKFGTLYLHEEGGFRLVAGHEVPEFIEARGSSPIQPAPGGGLDTAMRTKRTAHLPDLAATQSYAERHPRMVEAVELGGMRRSSRCRCSKIMILSE
jgi:GAF domain-containing protein